MTKDGSLQTIGKVLIKRGETLAVAESVTSGLVMAEFSLAKNATNFFQGGLTAYNLGQKARHLDIDPIIGEKTNCVSEIISRQMAINVAGRFCCPWGIGITGYAVPVPDLKIKSCFAFYAVAYNGKIVLASRIDSPSKGQGNVQRFFVNALLKEFATHLLKMKAT